MMVMPVYQMLVGSGKMRPMDDDNFFDAMFPLYKALIAIISRIDSNGEPVISRWDALTDAAAGIALTPLRSFVTVGKLLARNGQEMDAEELKLRAAMYRQLGPIANLIERTILDEEPQFPLSLGLIAPFAAVHTIEPKKNIESRSKGGIADMEGYEKALRHQQ